MYRLFAALLVVLVGTAATYGQAPDTTQTTKFDTIKGVRSDTLAIEADTIVSEITVVKKHSPTKAALFSAALPGLGQIYNKKYWKLPIIYGGMAALVYATTFNAKKVNTYKSALRLRLDGDSTTIDEFEDTYTEGQLFTLRDYYKRNLDLSIVGMAVLYALNIIDATVDAHLYSFDVSDDLSLKVQPVIQSYGNNRYYHGITLNLRL